MKKTLTLLVAEDNSDDIFLLREAFKKAGVKAPLHAVTDGSEAIAYLKGEGPYADRVRHPYPDALLLDLNMPRRNGFEVLEWIRHDPRSSRLIVYVLSASARQADVRRAYELHANSYIVKPTRIDELVAFAAALHAWHRFAVPPPLPESTESPPSGSRRPFAGNSVGFPGA